MMEGQVIEAEVVEASETVQVTEQTTVNQTEQQPVPTEETVSLAVLTFDEADALAIEQMLKGVVSDKLVYRFKDKSGAEVKGLSVVGVRSAVHYLNTRKEAGIRINDDLRIDFKEINGELWVIATVSASDNFGNRWFGAAQQPVNMRRKDGTVVADPFAVAKAVSKAQRNALRGLFPEPIVVELIDLWTKEGKVIELTEQDAPLTAQVSTQESEPPKAETQKPETPKPEPPVQIMDDRQLWREIYKVAKSLFGNGFKDNLQQIVQERYGVDKLQLPTEQALDLLTYLRQMQKVVSEF